MARFCMRKGEVGAATMLIAIAIAALVFMGIFMMSNKLSDSALDSGEDAFSALDEAVKLL